MPLTRIAHAQTYRVFFGTRARGNTASVLRLDEFGSVSEMQAIAKQLATPATCFYLTQKNHSSSDRNHTVRWFSARGEIQFCGHGSIALCKHLGLTENQPVQIDFPRGVIKLKTSTLKTRKQQADGLKNSSIESHQDLHWFSTITPKSIPCDQSRYKQLVESTLKQRPEELRLVGNNQGYLLAEFNADLKLGSLVPDLHGYANQTDRALIIVHRSSAAIEKQSKTVVSDEPVSDANSDYDYELRYFAPKHSSVEDSATGSANAIAAQYLMNKYGATQLCGYQASAQGGRIFSQMKDGELWVGGAAQRQ